MLKLYIITDNLSYKNGLNSVCKRIDIAVCEFSDGAELPTCNVPIGCFNSAYFDITGKQLQYYKQVIQYVDLYHNAIKTCMYYSMLHMLLYKVFIGDLPSSYCNPDCGVSLIPHPKAIEYVPEDSAGNLTVQVSVSGDGAYYFGVDHPFAVMI